MKQERRKGDRTYPDDIEMEVGQSSYKIYNLSPTGFCIFSTDPKAFTIGDVLSPIKLEFIEGEESAMGQVMHVTQFSEGKQLKRKLWMVGIKFLFQEDNDSYFRKQFEELNREFQLGANSLFSDEEDQ